MNAKTLTIAGPLRPRSRPGPPGTGSVAATVTHVKGSEHTPDFRHPPVSTS